MSLSALMAFGFVLGMVSGLSKKQHRTSIMISCLFGKRKRPPEPYSAREGVWMHELLWQRARG
jgi:hypothetical protein